MITTKEQELKALEKIEKILSELGENSYVGTAFDGSIQIAKSNIENDFLDSTSCYIDECKSLKERLSKETHELKKNYDNAENAVLEMSKSCKRSEIECENLKDLLKEANRKIARDEIEINRIKAIAFDYMMKEEKTDE